MPAETESPSTRRVALRAGQGQCSRAGGYGQACVQIVEFVLRTQPLKTPPLCKANGRPAITDLDRLRHRFWIRALLRQSIDPIGDDGVELWTPLAGAIFPELQCLKKHNLQALSFVRDAGIDPATVIRRIEKFDLECDPDPTVLAACLAMPDAKWVTRRPSGRLAAGEDTKLVTEYLEIKTNLVELGELIAPGSSDWETAGFWRLAQPRPPQLDTLREAIFELKGRLGLCAPNREQRYSHLSRDALNDLNEADFANHAAIYRSSLTPIVESGKADAISLLAALVAETFITDQAVLHAIHRDAFDEACNILLKDPLMMDINSDFKRLVAMPILCGSWEMPVHFHVSSLNAPFMSCSDFEELQRERYLGFRPEKVKTQA